jgi:hypothetical protein
MTRRSYVMVNGKLYEKTGDNSAIIDGENWYCISGHWAPAGASFMSAPMIMGDIQPYTSTLTGETISSRSQHRTHLRDHGCIEVGNERLAPPKPTWTASNGLRQELIARLNG